MAIAELSFESGETSLSTRTFRIEERMNRWFRVVVRARSPRLIDLDAFVGRSARFSLATGYAHAHAGPRAWAGVCRRFEQIRAEVTGLSTYEIEIVPTLWLLTQRTNHRVHQHLAIPDIVARVLGEWNIQASWEIAHARYPKLWYRVQYGESDYAFVTRLLEEAGISFSFSDEADTPSLLRFADAPAQRAARAAELSFVDTPNEAAEREFATEVALAREARSAAATLRDHDLRRPAFGLFGADGSSRFERYRYAPGAFVVESRPSGETPVADDRGAARHDERYGAELATRAAVAEKVGERAVGFRTNAFDLAPGTVFAIADHPHPLLATAPRLFAIERDLDGSVDGAWTARGRALLADAAYTPPQTTKKPVVSGVQSATVVGPSGEEIHTDEFGRVRVQFPWDRLGTDDEKSSAWVRVSEGWAGTGFGLVTIPRVGQEVLVGFLEGDPDQPVVVGRVFNALHPHPYPLPDNKTRSTWRSRSSPNGEGYNEITMEDATGQELLFVRAEKDLRKLVNHDETITVVGDRQKLVKGSEVEKVGGDRTEVTGKQRVELTLGDRVTVVSGNREEFVAGDALERVEKDRVLSVDQDQHVVIHGTKRELVGGDAHLLVRGKRVEQIGQNYNLSAGSHQIACGSQFVGAGKYIHLKAGDTIVVEAPDITLKSAGGFVRIDASGVVIQGSHVWINSGGAPGVLPDGGGARPELPREAEVAVPVAPEPDDVSVTGLAR